MKILAFAASNSSQSINRQLVISAIELLKSEILPSADVELLDLNDYEMPIYSFDREIADGIPQQAQKFFDKIGGADALIISYAEHNGLYTAAFKNIFDWASRIEMRIFQNKPILAMSASIGPNGGANVMRTAIEAAPHFGSDIRASFSVGPFGEKFDAEAGRLKDPELWTTLRDALHTLVVEE